MHKHAFESEKERGSIFTFTIPCKTSLTESAQNQAQTARLEGPGKSLTILLVEDNLINQKLAAKILEKAGHSVIVANTGNKAIQLFKQISFDVVLMDIMMPEMSGEETTAEIRSYEKELGTHVPIIAVTAHAMEGSRQRYLGLGMDGYVSKPLSKETLLGEIYTLTNHE